MVDTITPPTADTKSKLAQTFKALTSVLSRASLFDRLGITHEGARNLYEVFGYKKSLSTQDYYDKYLRQDIAVRVVDAFPSATWATPPTITGTQAFNKKWKEMNTQFKVFTVFQRLDRLLGLGDYAVLVLGLNDNRPLELPAKPRQGLELIYLQPYGQNSMQVQTWDESPQSPRFGLPVTYQLQSDDIQTQSTPQVVFKRKPVFIHYTRCIHVVEDPLENEVFGVARLQRVYNLLDDLLKVCGGTAETYWITANRGIQADVDKDMAFSTEDAKELTDEIEEYIHKLRRVIRTRGVKITSLGSDVPDPRGVFDILVTMLSGSLGIPKRILLGSEAGQLASDQDRSSWANRIEERRNNFAEPSVLLPFFNRMLDLKILPSGPTKFEWPSAFRMSPLERAQTAAQKARSAANLFKLLPQPPKAVAVSTGIPAQKPTPKLDANGKPIKNPDGTTQMNPVEQAPAPIPAPVQPQPDPEPPLLTRDEMRRIILIDDVQPNFDSPQDIAKTKT